MSPLTGFALVVIGGIMQGTYFLGLRYAKPWKWENVWSAYALFALIILPVGLAVATVPHLGAVYGRTPGKDLLVIFLYGAGWGIGSVLSGLGVARLGMAIGVSVLLGISAALGSLVPLVLNTPELVFAKKGLLVIASVVTLLLGVLLVALGGKERDRSQAGGAPPVLAGSFAGGLAICIFSGIFSSMINFALAFSKSLSQAALSLGATGFGSVNAVWMVALAAGFIANAIYTIYLLSKNRTWSKFVTPGTGRGWVVAFLMAVVWAGGLLLYGNGASSMGQLGSVLGWPVLMAIVIIVSSLWGVVSGEWKGASSRAKRLMFSGLVVLMAASGLVGIVNKMQ
ncbi:MAG: L-rhamnose/proton symporter RhaT [Terriglobia bacterium]